MSADIAVNDGRAIGDRADPGAGRRAPHDVAADPRAAWQGPDPQCRRRPGCRGLPAQHRGGAGDRAALRARRRADHPLRHRHVARGAYHGAQGRGDARSVADGPGDRGQSRGSRLPGAGGRDAKGAERPSAGHRPVLPGRSRRGCLDRRHDGDARVRDQCGALWHDARKRARPHRGHRRRHDHQDRRTGQEIGRGLRPHAAVRRLRGDPWGHHGNRSSGCTACQRRFHRRSAPFRRWTTRSTR